MKTRHFLLATSAISLFLPLPLLTEPHLQRLPADNIILIQPMALQAGTEQSIRAGFACI